MRAAHAQPHWHNLRSARGYTLVEVIVAIGIVGLLAALLMPVIGTVRDRAHEAECLANLRSIGGALELYRQQHERLLPRCSPLPSGDPFSPPDGLNGALQHYVAPDSPGHICPADFDPGSHVIHTSYFYVPGAFMLMYPPDPYPAARQVTTFFENEAPSIPIVWDSVDRHFIGMDLPRNGLYIDGHTDRVGEPFTIPGE